MTCFTIEVDTRTGGFFEYNPESDTVRYWAGTGLPDYIGWMEGFAKMFPEVIEELTKRKILKKTAK